MIDDDDCEMACQSPLRAEPRRGDGQNSRYRGQRLLGGVGGAGTGLGVADEGRGAGNVNDVDDDDEDNVGAGAGADDNDDDDDDDVDEEQDDDEDDEDGGWDSQVGNTPTQHVANSQDDDDDDLSNASPQQAQVWGRLTHTQRSAMHGSALELSEGLYVAGRADDNGIPLGDPSVSTQHCKIYREGNAVFLKDLGSSNGTYLLGKRIKKGTAKELKNGDVFSLVRGRPFRGVKQWFELSFEKVATAAQRQDVLHRMAHADATRLDFVARPGQGLPPLGAHAQHGHAQHGQGQHGQGQHGQGQQMPMPMQMQVQMHLGCPELESAYVFGPELGRGAHGMVIRAQHRVTGADVAIKVVDKRQLASTHRARRVEEQVHEALIMQQVDHKGITKLYDVVSTDRWLFLVMEYVRGGELFARLEALGAYPELEARGLMRNILEAVEYLHDQDIVHRDLKPENILMVSPADPVAIKLADFGLAKEERQGRKTICGTPDFIAPEVLQRRHTLLGQGMYGKEADMWSLGVIAFMVLTASNPFPMEEGCTLNERMHFMLSSDEWRSLSPVAHSFVLGMLEVDAKGRLSAREALQHPWILHGSFGAMPAGGDGGGGGGGAAMNAGAMLGGDAMPGGAVTTPVSVPVPVPVPAPPPARAYAHAHAHAHAHAPARSLSPAPFAVAVAAAPPAVPAIPAVPPSHSSHYVPHPPPKPRQVRPFQERTNRNCDDTAGWPHAHAPVLKRKHANNDVHDFAHHSESRRPAHKLVKLKSDEFLL